MKAIDLIFQPEDRERLPVSIAKRIPILVGMDVMLIFYFIVAAFARYVASPDSSRHFFVAVLITNVLFLVSLALIRLRRYQIASYFGSCTMLLQVMWIAFLLPAEGSSDIYRFVVYLIASATANSMVSLDRRQIPIYFFAGMVVFFIAIAVVFVPVSGGFTAEIRTITITLFLVNIATTIALFFTSKLNAQLQELAESEAHSNREKAAALTTLIADAKESMEIGKTLLEASEESMTRGAEIRSSLSKLDTATAELSSDAKSVDGSNASILEYAKRMRNTVADQNKVIEENTSSITQISATIRNISNLAQNRKTSMKSVLADVENQEAEIKKVMEGFTKIRETSELVLGAVKSILDVSEKTDMLAMNASIEAAHAGAAGKGFAVISSEIRKLSEETRQSTGNISSALLRNEAAVKDASTIIQSFASDIAVVVADVKATFDAMEEIINGLAEISGGTDEIASSADNMVSIAKDAEENAKGVTERLSESSSAIAQISELAHLLKSQVERVLVDFGVIENALEKIKVTGDRNAEEIASLGSQLDAIIER